MVYPRYSCDAGQCQGEFGSFLDCVVQVCVKFQLFVEDYTEVASLFSWCDCCVVQADAGGDIMSRVACEWMSMYLLRSNWALCFSFHSSLLVRIVCSLSMLFCAVCPLMPYAMLSINPRARSGALGISRSSALYSMNRIGESGDPCGIPASMLMSVDVVPLNRNLVVLPVRKLYTSLVICSRMRLCFMLWISLL